MLDLEECWAAVESRDAAADGSFFYGVRTTGVYCRPGCASRRPLRTNTVFFETPAAAEAAGLRACKRCRPTDGSAASRHLAAIERACALLRTSESMPASPSSPTRRRSAAFIFTACSSRSPGSPRAITRAATGSAVSPRSSMPGSRSPPRSTPQGSGRARAPMKPPRPGSA